jgi:hypothetical protein
VIARWYAPSLGTFVSDDPVESSLTSPASLDRYVYASGDAIDNSDRDGRTATKLSFTNVGYGASGSGCTSTSPSGNNAHLCADVAVYGWEDHYQSFDASVSLAAWHCWPCVLTVNLTMQAIVSLSSGNSAGFGINQMEGYIDVAAQARAAINGSKSVFGKTSVVHEDQHCAGLGAVIVSLPPYCDPTAAVYSAPGVVTMPEKLTMRGLTMIGWVDIQVQSQVHAFGDFLGAHVDLWILSLSGTVSVSRLGG